MDLSTGAMTYPLRLTATNAPMSYKLYEVSACTVGILTLDHLTLKDYLVMEAEGRSIPLRVAEVLTPIRPKLGPLIQRYRLTCLDCLMELDRLLSAVWEAAPGPLQFPRVLVNPKIYVEASCPGRERMELFESVDISRTGLLLKVVKGSDHVNLPSNAPFPLRVDVAKLWLPETLEPLVRIVRSYNIQEQSKTFSYMAVRFIDFNQRDGRDWNRLLRRIERGFLPGLSQIASCE